MYTLRRWLGSHLLNPWVETIGKEELEIYEEITPKEHQDSHNDCKDANKISQQDQITDSMDKQQSSADSLGSANSQGSV